MTIDEVKRMPPLADKRIAEILAFQDTNISDCPELTDEQLAGLKSNQQKVNELVQIDSDIIEWFKKTGDDYQARINNALRHVMV
jgi:uncharacterized protein (DUF4415 family)